MSAKVWGGNSEVRQRTHENAERGFCSPSDGYSKAKTWPKFRRVLTRTEKTQQGLQVSSRYQGATSRWLPTRCIHKRYFVYNYSPTPVIRSYAYIFRLRWEAVCYWIVDFNFSRISPNFAVLPIHISAARDLKFNCLWKWTSTLSIWLILCFF